MVWDDLLSNRSFPVLFRRHIFDLSYTSKESNSVVRYLSRTLLIT
jgi:hypothetical protein